jgi:hypothetical protein
LGFDSIQYALYIMKKKISEQNGSSFFLFPQKKIKLNFLTFDKENRKKLKLNEEFLLQCSSFIPPYAILGQTQITDGVQVNKNK